MLQTLRTRETSIQIKYLSSFLQLPFLSTRTLITRLSSFLHQVNEHVVQMLHANRSPLSAQSAAPAPHLRHQQLGLDEPDGAGAAGVPSFDPFSSVLSPLPSYLTQAPPQAPAFPHPTHQLAQQQFGLGIGLPLDLSDGGAAFARLHPPRADGYMQPPLFGAPLFHFFISVRVSSFLYSFTHSLFSFLLFFLRFFLLIKRSLFFTCRLHSVFVLCSGSILRVPVVELLGRLVAQFSSR